MVKKQECLAEWIIDNKKSWVNCWVFIYRNFQSILMFDLNMQKLKSMQKEVKKTQGARNKGNIFQIPWKY